jgi:transcriptional regulator with XRE-family HTH domain
MQVAIITLRERLGISQAQLADMLEIQLPSVGRLETTDAPAGPTLMKLFRIAHALGHKDLEGAFYSEIEKRTDEPKGAALLAEANFWRGFARNLPRLKELSEKLEGEQLRDPKLAHQLSFIVRSLGGLYALTRRWEKGNR